MGLRTSIAPAGCSLRAVATTPQEAADLFVQVLRATEAVRLQEAQERSIASKKAEYHEKNPTSTELRQASSGPITTACTCPTTRCSGTGAARGAAGGSSARAWGATG